MALVNAVKSKELASALEVLGLVPARSGVLPSEMIRLECASNMLYLSLAAESLGRVQVPCPGDKGKWEFFVDRGMLSPFVLVMKDFYKSESTITFKFDADKQFGKLTIKSGRRTLHCQGCQPVTGYGDLPSIKNAAKLAITSKQGQLMRLASQYATADPTAAHLNCIFLVSKTCVLTSNQVTVFSAPGKFPVTIPFPLGMLSALEADQLQEILFTGKVVVASFGFGQIAQTVPVQAAKNFPATQIQKRLVEARKMPKILSISGSSLAGVSERLAAYVAATMRQDVMLRVQSLKGKSSVLSIEAAVPAGSFNERVSASVLKAPIDWEWMLHFVLPFVQYAATQKLQIDVRYKDTGAFHLQAGDAELIMAKKLK